MNNNIKVLVTGADQHQGLAVIRGLGIAGIPVIACGAEPRSLGFYSKYAVDRFVYTNPWVSKSGFIRDIVPIIKKTNPGLIIPSVDSTLVALDECREEFEPYACLAAPCSEVLAYAYDKCKTLQLAKCLDVPAPATVRGDTLEEILEKATSLRFPVAIKPRGHQLYAPTAHTMDFKSRYARNLTELKEVLEPLGEQLAVVLVQECVSGIGVCVSAVFNNGDPVVMFPYVRVREVPLSGGVSVLRESVKLDERLRRYVTALLKEIKWHGVAMVEFKYDERCDSYTLMEINGRFQASTALSLDAGLNLPYLVACLYGGWEIKGSRHYKIGIRERWLSGDILALHGHLTGTSTRPTRSNPRFLLPPKGRVIWDFVKDFRPGTKYDEFKLFDWKPGIVECWALIRLVGQLIRSLVGTVARSLGIL